MGCKKNDWVQIRTVILPAGERAPQVPEETQAVPLIMLTKGFANHKAEAGELVSITAVTGMVLEGELVAVNPAYGHDYGQPVPELLQIGMELRQQLEGAGDE